MARWELETHAARPRRLRIRGEPDALRRRRLRPSRAFVHRTLVLRRNSVRTLHPPKQPDRPGEGGDRDGLPPPPPCSSYGRARAPLIIIVFTAILASSSLFLPWVSPLRAGRFSRMQTKRRAVFIFNFSSDCIEKLYYFAGPVEVHELSAPAACAENRG